MALSDVLFRIDTDDQAAKIFDAARHDDIPGTKSKISRVLSGWVLVLVDPMRFPAADLISACRAGGAVE